MSVYQNQRITTLDLFSNLCWCFECREFFPNLLGYFLPTVDSAGSIYGNNKLRVNTTAAITSDWSRYVPEMGFLGILNWPNFQQSFWRFLKAECSEIFCLDIKKICQICLIIWQKMRKILVSTIFLSFFSEHICMYLTHPKIQCRVLTRSITSKNNVREWNTAWAHSQFARVGICFGKTFCSVRNSPN